MYIKAIVPHNSPIVTLINNTIMKRLFVKEVKKKVCKQQ